MDVDKKSDSKRFGLLDLLKFFCYSFVCVIAGFFAVWLFFRLVDGSPENVCNELGKTFKLNDTFAFSSCKLHNDDEIVLVLDVKKGMEVYFDEIPAFVSEEELSSTQLDYYCAQFFDRVRISSLDLNVRVKQKVRQRIHISRNVCM